MNEPFTKSANILLVEDDLTFRNSTEQILAHRGHLVTSLKVEDLLGGLPSEIFDTFNLIICELEKTEFALVLNEIRKHSAAPVILFSNSKEGIDQSHNFPNTIAATKPLKPAELLKKIDEALQSLKSC